MISALLIPFESHLFVETSKKILNKVIEIVNEKDQDVIEITNSIDINSKIELVETLVRDIINELKNDHLAPNASLEIILLQLSNILNTIHNNTIELKKRIDYHKTLWFRSFRSTNYSIIIESLKENKILLDARMNDLIKIAQLFKTIKNEEKIKEKNIEEKNIEEKNIEEKNKLSTS